MTRHLVNALDVPGAVSEMSDQDAVVLNQLANICNANSGFHGFYDEVHQLYSQLDPKLGDERWKIVRVWTIHWIQGSFMRMVSEIAEANEYVRKDLQMANPDNHCPEYSGVMVELSDAIIRILDTAKFIQNLLNLSYGIGQTTRGKHNYNIKRPHKHGKNS